ncbi:hypothetical protein PYW07_011242 [Mythimna separata]|uniref:Uncharacterized protein n=1 Tax=Mythimna separata TaxID=271217 RepID=A0AAD7Y844_MYTSE|nr:hypothetical protein PYW07_011242 [Mythimna separata]
MRALTPLACALVALLPLSKAAVPGAFFWKPRVGLDISLPTAQPRVIHKPTADNIKNGLVVVIDGYQAGLTVAALANYLLDLRTAFPHLHPGQAPYYTNMYRWAARHLSLFPDWFGGKKQNYVKTHEVWKKRFFYMNYFVPQWMRKILFFVKDESWKHEEWEFKEFEKYAEPYFGKFYRYPSKEFDNYKSMQHYLTGETKDPSDNSISD